MLESPDVVVYVEALRARIVGQPLDALWLNSPFLLRSVEVPPATLVGRKVNSVERLGKRIVTELAGQYFMVLHLMIAGRLHWRGPDDKRRGGKPHSAPCQAVAVEAVAKAY